MKLSRLISTDAWKGTPGYLNSQRNYEIAKTVLLFGVSLSLFFAGFFTTNTRLNLLTIVAVLGCLPASKSLVGAIMFCRYRSLPGELKERFASHEGNLLILHDMIFTGYDKNYPVEHIAIKGNTVCGYSTAERFDEQAFQAHIMPLLKKDHFSDVNFKVFTDAAKYADRLDGMQTLSCDEKNTSGIAETLKSISL